MFNLVKGTNKTKFYSKALIARNPAIVYHKAVNQNQSGAPITSYSQFRRNVRIAQSVIALVMFFGGIIFSLPKLYPALAASSINLSGIAYQENRTTPIDGTADNKTIQVAVNGVIQTSDTITDNTGSWGITGLSVNSGDIITVFLDEETEEANMVFESNETTQTNIDLYRNHVIVRSDTATITNTEIITGINADSDVKFSSPIATDIEIVAGFHLYVWGGDTFSMDDSVSVGSGVIIAASATLTANGNPISVPGNWTNAGTFTPGGNTVTFNSGVAGQSLTTGSSINNGSGAPYSETAGKKFYNVTIATTGGGTVTLAASSDLSVGGDLVFTSGRLDIGSNDNKILIAGDWDASTVTESAFEARESTWNDFPQVHFVGSSTQMVKIASGEKLQLDSLEIGDVNGIESSVVLSTGGSAATLAYDLYLVVLAGTFDTQDGVNASVNISGNGSDSELYVGDEFGEDSATYKRFYANSSTINNIKALFVTDGRVGGDDATFYAEDSTITLLDSINVGDSSVLAHAVNVFDASATSANTISIDRIDVGVGTFILGDSRIIDVDRATVQQYGIRVYANGTWDASTYTSNATVNVAGNIIVDTGGSFQTGSTTFVLDGTVAQQVDSDVNLTFYALTIDDTASRTVTLHDTDTAGRSFVVNGTFTWDSTTPANAANISIGNVTYSASVTLNSGSIVIPSGHTLTIYGTGTLDVSGSWTNAGTFTPNSSTVTFIGSSGTQTINSTGAVSAGFSSVVIDSLGATKQLSATNMAISGNLTVLNGTLDLNGRQLQVNGYFNKSGGNLNMDQGGDNFNVDGTFTVSGDAGGSVLTAGSTVVGGDVDISGDNTFVMGHATNYPVFSMDGAADANLSIVGANNAFGYTGGIGEFDVDKTGGAGVTLLSPVQSWNFLMNTGELDINGQTLTVSSLFVGFGGLLTMASGTIATGSDNLVPSSHAMFYVDSGWTENISGGTITVEGVGHVTNGAAYFANGSAFTPTGGTFQFIGNDNKVLTIAETGEADFNFFNLTIGDGVNALTVDINPSVAITVDLEGDMTIATSATLDSNGEILEVAGGWDTNGTYTHGNSTVTFDSADTGETIEAGSSQFYNMVFNNAAGGWTVQTDNLTVANNLTLTSANTFTVSSGVTIEVRNDFTNSVGGANTTWTGAALYLNGTSASLDEINTKTVGGDVYGTLRIGVNENAAMWSSSASTVTVDSGSCLESFDNGAVDGQINIYGECNSRSAEYWVYENDFDGTALGLSSRPVTVNFSSGSSYTVDSGDILYIVGSAGDFTDISATSGYFSLTVNGIIHASNYNFDNLDASGLKLNSTATIYSLDNGSFDNNGPGANSSYITLSNLDTVNMFGDVIFDSQTDGEDTNVVYNVNATGSTINLVFPWAGGNKFGSEFEIESSGAQISWTILPSVVNDGLTGDASITNDPTELSANWETAQSCSEDNVSIFTPSDGMKSLDFSVVEKDGVYHVIHIRGEDIPWWAYPQTTFGHETSTDLNNWTNQGPIDLHGSVGEWNDKQTWAPYIYEEGGTYYMYYTGVNYDTNYTMNAQRIGLATSTDLVNWTDAASTCSGIGGQGCVLDCSAAWSTWDQWDSTAWKGDCRDPFVTKWGSTYYMFMSAKKEEGATDRMVIAFATSSDLLNWTLQDPIDATLSGTAESPTVTEHNGTYYMFGTRYDHIQYYTTTTPTVAASWVDQGYAHQHFANEAEPYIAGQTLFPYVHGETWAVRFLKLGYNDDGSLRYSNNVTPACQSGGSLDPDDQTTPDAVDHFEYAIGSTEGGTDVSDFSSVGLLKNATKTGLDLADGTYYTTVRAINSSGEVIGQSSSNGIMLDSGLPTFSNVNTNSTQTSITIQWTSSEPATTQVNYGLTNAYGFTTVLDSTLTLNHSVTITGLNAGTTYHFQLVGEDGFGNTGYSIDYSTETVAPDATIITNVQVINLTETAASITWQTNHPADSRVNYGLNTDYGQEKYDSGLVSEHLVQLTGLEPGTVYHYQIVSTGNTVATQADANFTTIATEVPDPDTEPPPIDIEPVPYLPAPTLYAPESGSIVHTALPTITGVARSNNDVFILIDRELVAVVKASDHSSGTGDFYFHVKEPLTRGDHSIILRARDNDGLISSESKSYSFFVEPPYPVPTIDKAYVTDGSNPSVVLLGNAINDATIRVYVNNRIINTFKVNNDPSGVANFKILISGLEPGEYNIYLDALEPSGKESVKTGTLNVVIKPLGFNVPIYAYQDQNLYTVQSGDTLWKIALKHYGLGDKWVVIQGANIDRYPSLESDPSVLNIGWTLLIPLLWSL
ncbi:MAG: family 43 glycosylhydrolase [Patescibacteria group bacterium]